MKITTLRERIEKANEKIAKKTNTIAKKGAQIEKKNAELAKLGYPGFTREEYYQRFDELDAKGAEVRSKVYWTVCDIENLVDDINRGAREIEETKKTLAKYEAELAGEIEKESIFLKEIPESMRDLQTELVNEWDGWDIERREFLKKQYKELGSREFCRKYGRSEIDAMHATDEDIHKENERAAKGFILNLYYRVKDITGEVTEWAGITLERGAHGFPTLTGYVIGKEGRAEVFTILAGGYNVQRLHIRVLVKERA